MKKYHSNDYPGQGFDDKPLTNGEIKEIYNGLYNVWWRPYSDMKVITSETLDKAYEEGIRTVETSSCRMAFDIFVGLFRQLEMRCVTESHTREVRTE